MQNVRFSCIMNTKNYSIFAEKERCNFTEITLRFEGIK